MNPAFLDPFRLPLSTGNGMIGNSTYPLPSNLSYSEKHLFRDHLLPCPEKPLGDWNENQITYIADVAHNDFVQWRWNTKEITVGVDGIIKRIENEWDQFPIPVSVDVFSGESEFKFTARKPPESPCQSHAEMEILTAMKTAWGGPYFPCQRDGFDFYTEQECGGLDDPTTPALANPSNRTLPLYIPDEFRLNFYLNENETDIFLPTLPVRYPVAIGGVWGEATPYFYRPQWDGSTPIETYGQNVIISGIVFNATEYSYNTSGWSCGIEYLDWVDVWIFRSFCWDYRVTYTRTGWGSPGWPD